MAKLYATLESDKGARIVGRGGNDFIACEVIDGNSKVLRVEYNREDNQLHVQDDTENMAIVINGFQVQ